MSGRLLEEFAPVPLQTVDVTDDFRWQGDGVALVYRHL
jgi:hypothetical protein